MAALAGLFSDHAAEKLKTVAAEIFQEPPKGKDAVAAEPAVTIAAPRERTATGAVLVGSVNPRGRETRYRFEWGETADYGSSAPVEPESIGSGLAPTPVTVEVLGLEPSKEYHYRLVAINDGGIGASPDKVLPPVAG
jgi:hypothetical protein